MVKIQVLKNPSLESYVYLKSLPQAVDDTSLIKLKPLEVCLPCSLVLKVVASFSLSDPSLYLAACMINHLSTVSRDSFYSTLNVVTKLFYINQRKAAFQDNKN